MKEKELQPVTFEQAKRLKAAGFDWRCIAGYNNDGKKVYCKREAYYGQTIYANDMTVDFNTNSAGGLTPDYFTVSVPSVVLALKWFRDEKACRVGVMDTREGKYGYRIFVKYHTEYDIEYQYSIINYDSFDAAESALLDELLTVLEKEER
jgi:hypothetical protein